jgi:hypothetical protein
MYFPMRENILDLGENSSSYGRFRDHGGLQFTRILFLLLTRVIEEFKLLLVLVNLFLNTSVKNF